MARKKGRRPGGSQPKTAEPSESETPTVTDAAPADAAPADAGEEVAFDQAASDRILSACASLSSLSATAVEEATYAATPFLSFAQRSRIRALATRFDTSGGGTTVVHAAPVGRVEAAVVEGGGLSREEIDGIVAHRVEIAVTELLQKLGVAPDSTIKEQTERTVATEIGSQEQRLLDWMKRHLTESLEMLESTLDDRIADFLEVDTDRSQTEVDAQLEEARENLLKNIDEVRTVDVGFDMDFAAGIVELDRTTGGHDSAAIEEALAEAGDIEVGGEDDDEEIALGGDDDEIEIAGEEEIEVAGEEEIEVGDDDIEIAGDDIEIAGDEDEVVADDIEIAGDDIEIAGDEDEVVADDIEIAGDEDIEVVADDIEIAGDEDEVVADDIEISGEGDELEITAGGDDDAIELELGEDDAATTKVATDVELEISVSDDGAGTEIALDDDDDLDSIDLETVAEMEAPAEDLEEISVVQAMPEEIEGDAIDEAALAEAMEVELEEDDVGLMTLGEGPDEIRIEDIRAELDAQQFDIEIDDDEDVEVTAEEEAAATGDDRLAIVAKYMDKASQMSARRQYTPAMELYSKVLDLEKTNFDALISRGLIYSETKDYKKATEDFKAAQSIAPDRAGSYYGLAELHYNRRQFNKAIKNYSQALKYDDKLAEAWCRRGLSYYYQKNYKKAYLDLFRAYDINPNLPKIKNFLKLVRNKLEETGG